MTSIEELRDQENQTTETTKNKNYQFWANFQNKFTTSKLTKAFNTKAEISRFLKNNTEWEITDNQVIRGYAIPVKKTQNISFN